MYQLRLKLEGKRRELEDLVVEIAAKSHAHARDPHDEVSDQMHKANEFVLKAIHALSMAGICLLEDP